MGWCFCEVEYILFDENVYADKHMGKPLKLKYDNLDMLLTEIFANKDDITIEVYDEK